MPRRANVRCSTIKWNDVLDYCERSAANGKLIMSLFNDEGHPPGDYDGRPTKWPSPREAFSHFVNNEEKWGRIERGYQYRSFWLHDRIQEIRERLIDGKIRPNEGRVIMDSCLKEIQIIGAAAVREKKELMAAIRKERLAREKAVKEHQKLLDDALTIQKRMEKSPTEQKKVQKEVEQGQTLSIAERLARATETMRQHQEEIWEKYDRKSEDAGGEPADGTPSDHHDPGEPEP